MSAKHVPNKRKYSREWETFADVAEHGAFYRMEYQSCRFCKKHNLTLEAYGLRQNICQPCAILRGDKLLPRVLKQRAFDRKLQAVRTQGSPGHARCTICGVVNGHKNDCALVKSTSEVFEALRNVLSLFGPNERLSGDFKYAVEARAILAKHDGAK